MVERSSSDPPGSGEAGPGLRPSLLGAGATQEDRTEAILELEVAVGSKLLF